MTNIYLEKIAEKERDNGGLGLAAIGGVSGGIAASAYDNPAYRKMSKDIYTRAKAMGDTDFYRKGFLDHGKNRWKGLSGIGAVGGALSGYGLYNSLKDKM